MRALEMSARPHLGRLGSYVADVDVDVLAAGNLTLKDGLDIGHKCSEVYAGCVFCSTIIVNAANLRCRPGTDLHTGHSDERDDLTLLGRVFVMANMTSRQINLMRALCVVWNSLRTGPLCCPALDLTRLFGMGGLLGVDPAACSKQYFKLRIITSIFHTSAKRYKY